ncbi:hypothetical protein Ga0466249_005439 [Sporomusaceae bacterium BoRhaA]|nr:hypothetical protein [Pelorhabdus rhamnosifermentans]
MHELVVVVGVFDLAEHVDRRCGEVEHQAAAGAGLVDFLAVADAAAAEAEGGAGRIALAAARSWA